MKGILLHTLCHILPRASIPHDRNCAVATIRPHKQPVHSLNSVGHWPSTHFLCDFASLRENFFVKTRSRALVKCELEGSVTPVMLIVMKYLFNPSNIV